MNKEESLTLLAQGRDAWNAWAEKMLAERRAMEAEGRWEESEAEWHAAAKADFSGHEFETSVHFDKLVFPSDAGFGEATFKGDAWFSQATFTGDAWFSRATFTGNARFSKARFAGYAWFGETVFTGDAWFGEATFTGNTWFIEVTFAGNAEFPQTVFGGRTSFDKVKFKQEANFHAIDVRSAFSLAGTTFRMVPDFIQAHFAEAPRLDNARIEPPGLRSNALGSFQKRIRRRGTNAPFQASPPAEAAQNTLKLGEFIANNFKGDPDRAARWRALKRLAIQGHDHARELEFFRRELLARRWNEDKPWHAVFWFGLLYQISSDFGRSVLQPFLWWSVSLVGFTGAYLVCHPAFNGRLADPGCVAGRGDAWGAALNLSFHKGLLVFGSLPLSKLNQTYACLYGIHPQGRQQPEQLQGTFLPIIPDPVTALGFAQNLLSAALIFLLLLAIRNHFRIK